MLSCSRNDGVASPKTYLSVRTVDVPVAVVCWHVTAGNCAAIRKESTDGAALVALVGAEWTPPQTSRCSATISVPYLRQESHEPPV